MKWSDVAGALAHIAPTIASAVGGPLAGTAVSTLETALGVPVSGTLSQRQDNIADVIAGASPEQLLALKQADNDFQVKMAQLGFQDAEALAALNTQDRASARSLAIATKDRTPRILACGVTIGFFGILSFMLFRAVPESSRDILNIMLGSLGAAFTAIVSYYYGSSAGSAEKTQLLAQAEPINSDHATSTK